MAGTKLKLDNELRALSPCVDGILESGSDKGAELILVLAELMAQRTDIHFECGRADITEQAVGLLKQILRQGSDTGFIRFVRIMPDDRPRWMKTKRDPRESGIYF